MYMSNPVERSPVLITAPDLLVQVNLPIEAVAVARKKDAFRRVGKASARHPTLPRASGTFYSDERKLETKEESFLSTKGTTLKYA
jgi:hypothetical protein